MKLSGSMNPMGRALSKHFTEVVFSLIVAVITQPINCFILSKTCMLIWNTYIKFTDAGKDKIKARNLKKKQ